MTFDPNRASQQLDQLIGEQTQGTEAPGFSTEQPPTQRELNSLGTSARMAAQTTPQQAAHLENQAKKFNVQPSTVREQPEQLATMEMKDNFRQASPLVRQMLSDPNFAAQVSDEIENLTRTERLVKAGESYEGSLWDRVREGWLNLRQLPTTLAALTPIQQGLEAQETGDYLVGYDPMGLPIYASQAFIGEGQREQIAQTAIEEGRGAAVNLATSVAQTQREIAALPQRPATVAMLQAETAGETWDAFMADPLGIIADITVTSMTQQAPALAAALATRNPAMAMATQGGNSYALELGNGVVDYLARQGVNVQDQQAIVDAMQDPDTVDRALAYANTRAAIITTFDVGSMGLATRNIIPDAWRGSEALNALVAQPIAQGAMGAGGEATAQLATEGEISVGEVFAEAIGEFGTAPIEAGAFAYERYVQHKQRETFASLDSAGKINSLIQGAENSNMTTDERKAKLKEFFANLGEQADADTVYLDPDEVNRLFQSQDITPEQRESEVFQQINSQLNDAVQKGERVEIPVSALVDLQEIELARPLQPHMTTDNDALTPAQTQSQSIRAEVEQLQTMDQEQLTSEAEVYNDVLGQLLAADVERSTAESQAILWEAFFRTMGNRTGRDPKDLFDEFSPSIRTEVAPELQRRSQMDDLDVALNRIREQSLPTDRQIYGRSLIQEIIALGGLTDEGGELAARDVDIGRVGRNRLVRPGGRSLDDLAETLVGTGFLTDRSPDALLDAIDRELAGEPVYSPQNLRQDLLTARESLAELDEMLAEAGFDIANMTNEEVRAALESPTFGDDVLTQAQERGYEGNNPVEAVEWNRAYTKYGPEGMTQEARMARAREMGFDTDTTYYHGTQANFTQFVPRPSGFGTATYLTDNAEEASGYATGDVDVLPGEEVDPTGAKVIPTFIRGNMADLRDDTFEAGGVDVQSYLESQDFDGLTTALQEAGFTGFLMDGTLAPIPARGSHAVVFDPRNIRSVNAAFDPDFSESANLLAQRAFHGTPNQFFTPFSTDYIGTGEGAQAYGWGLYFASRRSIAEFYRNELADTAQTEVTYQGTELYEQISSLQQTATDEDATLIHALRLMDEAIIRNRGNAEQAQQDAIRTMQLNLRIKRQQLQTMQDSIAIRGYRGETEPRRVNGPEYSRSEEAAAQRSVARTERGLQIIRDMDPAQFTYTTTQPGQIHQVNIPENEDLLNREVPVDQQSERVQQRLEPVVNEIQTAIADAERQREFIVQRVEQEGREPTREENREVRQLTQEILRLRGALRSGEKLYDYLENELGSDQAASERLMELAIPGLRYLDAGARGARGGQAPVSYNFVIWDDSVVTQEMIDDRPIGDIREDPTLYQLQNNIDPESGQYTMDFEAQPERPTDRVQQRTAVVSTEQVSQIDAGFETLDTAGQVAAATKSLSRGAQEKLWAVVTDADGRPIEVLNHSLGERAAATADHGIIAGWATNVPGAANLWLSHNHPSGISELSRADHQVSGRVANLLDGTEIQYHGIMAVTPTDYTAEVEPGNQTRGGMTDDFPAPETSNKVPVTERMLDQVALPSHTVNSPDAAKQARNDIGRDQQGVMLLDNQHNVVGFLPLDMTRINQLRGDQLSTLLGGVEGVNASAAVIVSEQYTPGFEGNLANAINAAGIRVLDILAGDNSLATRSQPFGTSDVFYQRQANPVPKSVDDVSNVQAAFDRAGGQNYATNRDFKVAIQDAVKAAAKEADVDVSKMSPEVERYLVRVALTDARVALQTNSNAIGWYDEKVTKALRVLEIIHPEIATDAEARFAFIWALATTSNGLKVDANFELAEKVYRRYKDEGQMPTDEGVGDGGKAMNISFDFFNKQVRKNGIQDLMQFSTTLQTMRAIQERTGKLPAKFKVDDVAYGAAAIGPKIGNGFFANLYGKYDQLTIDRWFMRTWGRWTGTLVDDRPDMHQTFRQKMQSLIRMMTNEDRRRFSRIIGVPVRKDVSQRGIDEIAIATSNVTKDADVRTELLTIGNVDGDDAGQAQLLETFGPARKGSDRVALGDEARKYSNNLVRWLDGQKEVPSSATEKNNIEQVMRQVLQELSQEHPALTMADLQALLWYPEKRLYDSAKTEEESKDYNDDEAPDYANAAINLAEKRGIERDVINNAILEADRDIENRKAANELARRGRRGTDQYGPGGTVPQDAGTERLFQRVTDQRTQTIERIQQRLREGEFAAENPAVYTNPQVIQLFTEIERLQVEVDQAYEQGDQQRAEDLDVELTQKQDDLENIVTELDEGDRPGVGALENVDAEPTLDEQLSKAYFDYNVSSFMSYEDDAAYVEALRSIIQDFGGDPSAFSDQQVMAAARDIYERRLGLRQRPLAGQPAALAQQSPIVRGYFERGLNQITLTENANLSTFLHESGHFFLEVMRELAPLSEEIRADLATLDTWFESQGATTDTEKHEAFASGFETYLMEGKAPTEELRSVFSRFRDWLTFVYKRLLRSTPFASNQMAGYQLSDEVRGVMDRMLATNEEINAATVEHRFGPFPEEVLGLEGEAAEEYRELVAEAREQATSELTTEVMGELNREQKEWWKQGVKVKEEEVAAEMEATPAYTARDHLSGTRQIEGLPEGAKLNSLYVSENYDRATQRKLNRMSAKDGISPDLAANWYGYSSGDQLILALANTLNQADRKKAIRAEAEARMKREHGDMMTDGSMVEAARTEVHNNKQEERLIRELQLLNARAGRRRTTARQVFREAAREEVSRTRIRDLRPDKHRRQEIRARDAALRAAMAGDNARAAVEQQRAVRQFYLYRESVAALEAADKQAKYARSFRGKKLNRIRSAGDTYYDQLLGVLEKFEFRRMSDRALDKRQGMREWLSKILGEAGEGNPEANHEVLTADEKAIQTQSDHEDQQKQLVDTGTMDRLIEEAGRTNWRELTPGELDAAIQSIRAIENLARLKNKLLTAKDKRDLDEWVTAFVDNLEANSTARVVKNFGSTLSWWEDRKRALAAFRDLSKTPTGILRMFDGFAENGVAWNLIGRPLQEAAAQETEQINQANKDVENLFSRYTDKELAKMNREQFDAQLGQNITHHDALSVLLNWGNQTNRMRIMDGFKIDEETAQHIMNTYLTEKDYLFAKDVWAYLETFKKAAFDLHRDLYGFTPDEVEADPFDSPYGVMPGGYYPIKYDAQRSSRAEQQLANMEAQAVGAPIQGRAKLGSTQARVNRVYRPMQTDMTKVIFTHVSDTIHHTTHDRALYDVGRILATDRVKAAITDHYGDHIYKQLTSMVRGIKDGTEQVKDVYDIFIQKMRNNATIAMLGFSIRTIVLQPFGITNSIAKARLSGIGMKGLMDGYANHFGNPRKSTRKIRDESVYMRNREETQSVAINRIKNRLRRKGRFDGAKEWAMVPIVKTQFYLVDAPLYVAARDSFLDQGMDEQTAIQLAEQVVRDAQGGGNPIDTAEAMLGGPYRKLFTNFLTYMITTYNLQSENFKRTFQLKEQGLYDFAVNTFVLITMPAILTALLNSFVAGEDDDEELPERILREQVSFLLGMNPLTAQVSGIATGFDYSGPQGTALFGKTVQLGQEITQGEVDGGLLRTAAWTFGLATGVPIAQPVRTFRGMAQAMEEDDDPATTLKKALFGPER